MSPLFSVPEAQSGHRVYGVAIGTVSDNKDPKQLGRVKLKLPWWSDDQESNWARVASFMGGAGRGAFFLPEVGDEVLVAFEHGDIHRPYVLGALWNTEAKPPTDNADGKNNLRIIKSRSGHQIRLDDTDKGTKIEIIDQTGGNSITINSEENVVSIRSAKDIRIQVRQGSIEVGDENSRNLLRIETAPGQVKVQAAVKAVVEAPQIELGEGATHAAVFGDQLLQYLNQLVQMYATHMHPGELALGVFPVTPAPPVPPLPPATPALLSFKVKSG